MIAMMEETIKASLDEKWEAVISCKEYIKNTKRLTKEEYGCLIALAVASRSEDPHTKAGCCIVDKHGRVLSTGYNGLSKSKSLPIILKNEQYRDVKRDLFIHAETNALSLIRCNEGNSIFLNINPCSSCAINIVAHGIKNVVFVYDYAKCQKYKHIFQFYNVKYRKISIPEKRNINDFIKSCIFIHDDTNL